MSRRKKREFIVKCHYPPEDKMEEFSNMYHSAVAWALTVSNTQEWLEAFKRELHRQIIEEESTSDEL